MATGFQRRNGAIAAGGGFTPPVPGGGPAHVGAVYKDGSTQRRVMAASGGSPARPIQARRTANHLAARDLWGARAGSETRRTGFPR